MDNADFGKVLRKIREDSGKTVQEVSEYLTSLGYKAKNVTIYGWERGVSQPSPDPFLAMCRFYGVRDVISRFSDVIEVGDSDGQAAQNEKQPAEDSGLSKVEVDFFTEFRALPASHKGLAASLCLALIRELVRHQTIGTEIEASVPAGSDRQ